jgi:uncharacterized protein (DUF1800 family)
MSMRRALASLSVAVMLAVLPAATKKPAAATPAEQQFRAPLTKDQRLTHVIERLSFGARPGDAERIRQMGLDRWIDDQIHPARIAENPVLEEKLRPLASLGMSNADLVRNYPPPQVVRAMYNGGVPLPSDPLVKAAVEIQIERYRAKKAEGDTPQQTPAASKPDPAVIRQRLLTVLDEKQIAALRQGSPDEKRALLTSIEPERIDKVLIALPQPMRRGLLPVASTEVKRKIMLLTTPQQLIPYDLNEAKLLRAIYSNRQLAELMADFWFNHFNVFIDKGADRTLVTSYEREAIRPNIFGKFRELLEATAHSPAMLYYLDNWESVATDVAKQGAKRKRGLNENYARELLELHTLGVDGGYTQDDIVNVARCFTGWTIRAPRQGGDFFYNDRWHDKSAKVVLGVVIPAGGGQNDAERVLDIVAKHPSTARFISRKLAMRFVSDDPPQALLDRMAQTFQASGGDIREIMKTMIGSPEFYSQGAFRAKIKTPFEMTVSAVRAIDANVDSASAIAQRLNELGEPLYRKIEPTGYPSRNSEWMNSSALLGRMNFALALTQGKLAGISIAPERLGSEADPMAIAQQLVASPLSVATRETIAKTLESQSDQKQPALVAGLLLGSPEFQRR